MARISIFISFDGERPDAVDVLTRLKSIVEPEKATLPKLSELRWRCAIQEEI